MIDLHDVDGPNDNPGAWAANGLDPDAVIAARIAQLEDTIGDAGACSDHDCSCKSAAGDAREELDRLLDADPIEQWKALRDAGYAETELRMAAGDR